MKEKEHHGHSQQIKLNNFTVSLWDKRKEIFIQPQLPLRLSVIVMEVAMTVRGSLTYDDGNDLQ